MSQYQFPEYLDVKDNRVTKAQAVQKLYDYWINKTNILKMRHDPNLAANTEHQEKAQKFLSDHSDLGNQPFWNALNGLGKQQVAQLFSIQEVTGNRKVRMQKNRLRASVYVVLSGTASVVKGGTTEAVVYQPGQVFGATDLFNDVVKNLDTYNNIEPEFPDDVVELENGTFMRLELGDLYNRVLNPPVEEEEDTREEDERIAEMSYEDLTEDDKFYIRVYKRTKELVNKNFFSFCDAYRMIPKNASMPAFKFYHEGSLGREIYLDENDPIFVFIIIEGAVRVDLATTRENRGHHALSCKRKGRKPMFVKTSAMPLMQLSSGTVMCIDESTFRIGRPAPPAPPMHDDDTVSWMDTGGSLSGTTHVSAPGSRGPGSATRGAIKNGTGAGILRGSLRARTGGGGGAGNASLAGSTSLFSQSTKGRFDGGLGATASLQSSHSNNNNNARGNTRGGHGQGTSALSKSFNFPFSSGLDRRNSESSIAAVSVNSGFASTFTLNSFASVDSKVHRRCGDTFEARSYPPADGGSGAEYHIKLVFERMTTYLAIPLANFEKLLKDEKLVMPKIAREVWWNLDHSNRTICHRIERLVPWIKGELAFNPMDPLLENREKPDFLLAEMANLDRDPRDPESSLLLPQGSFLQPQKSVEDAVPTPLSVKKAPVKEATNDLIMQAALARMRQSLSGDSWSCKQQQGGGMFLTQQQEPSAKQGTIGVRTGSSISFDDEGGGGNEGEVSPTFVASDTAVGAVIQSATEVATAGLAATLPIAGRGSWEVSATASAIRAVEQQQQQSTATQDSTRNRSRTAPAAPVSSQEVGGVGGLALTDSVDEFETAGDDDAGSANLEGGGKLAAEPSQAESVKSGASKATVASSAAESHKSGSLKGSSSIYNRMPVGMHEPVIDISRRYVRTGSGSPDSRGSRNHGDGVDPLAEAAKATAALSGTGTGLGGD